MVITAHSLNLFTIILQDIHHRHFPCLDKVCIMESKGWLYNKPNETDGIFIFIKTLGKRFHFMRKMLTGC